MRFSSSTRLWSRSERAQLLSRTSYAGTLCVMQTRRPDGSLTPPFLIITGPTASAPRGEPLSLSSPLTLYPDSDEPPLDSFAPLSVSLLPTSREILRSVRGPLATRHTTLAQETPTLTIPDIRRWCSYIVARDASGPFSMALPTTRAYALSHCGPPTQAPPLVKPLKMPRSFLTGMTLTPLLPLSIPTSGIPLLIILIFSPCRRYRERSCHFHKIVFRQYTSSHHCLISRP